MICKTTNGVQFHGLGDWFFPQVVLYCPNESIPASENDCTRYTIHPDTRKKLLKRLLQLNHKLYAEEEAKGLHKKKAGKKAKMVGDGEQPTLL